MRFTHLRAINNYRRGRKRPAFVVFQGKTYGFIPFCEVTEPAAIAHFLTLPELRAEGRLPAEVAAPKALCPCGCGGEVKSGNTYAARGCSLRFKRAVNG
ncbi:MAG: hypothetical protein V2A77_02495 [Pseudomonadota bacterium]